MSSSTVPPPTAGARPVLEPVGATVTQWWTRDGAVVAGETTRRYAPTAADVGARLGSTVVVTAPGYATRTFTTASSDPVAPSRLVAEGEPTVQGTAQVGAQLTAVPPVVRESPPALGAAARSVTLADQWLRDGVEVAGADRAAYAVGPADLGGSLSVRVNATAPVRHRGRLLLQAPLSAGGLATTGQRRAPVTYAVRYFGDAGVAARTVRVSTTVR